MICRSRDEQLAAKQAAKDGRKAAGKASAILAAKALAAQKAEQVSFSEPLPELKYQVENSQKYFLRCYNVYLLLFAISCRADQCMW